MRITGQGIPLNFCAEVNYCFVLQEVKHTRNIIAAHMKMVHLISWKEYQEILIKIRLGENVGDLPAPDLFEVKKTFLTRL